LDTSTRIDEAIRADVLSQLKRAPKITSPDNIEVKLSETRTDPEIARDAIRASDAHPGVPAQPITNLIEVKPSVSPVEIKIKIEDALKRSAELDARRITVEVDGPTVKLYRKRAVLGRAGGRRARRLVRARNGSGRKPYHDRAIAILAAPCARPAPPTPCSRSAVRFFVVYVP
jgi:hypothetical protein